jgi:hypothetical protein
VTTSRPCTRHGRRRITWHRRILRSDNANYARVLTNRADNLPSLVATRSESLPITSRAGNDRNASPGELDFMHGRMIRRHEGCVRTILTESGFSIAPPMRDFNDSASQNRDASRQVRRARGFSS